MNAERQEALERAYRATTYRVFLPQGACDLRVGQRNAAFEQWLQALGGNVWAILTAANPGSQRLDDAANRQRQEALEGALRQAGYVSFAGENLADAADWPAEATRLVIDIQPAATFALAARFGQNAVLLGALGQAPTVVWTGAAKAAI